MWLTCLRSKVMGSLGRARRILKPRVREYLLTRGFLGLRILMEKCLRCNPCRIWVTKLWDHREAKQSQTRSTVWLWSLKERLDLIGEENRMKGLFFFWDLNAMIQMMTLTQINLGREMILKLGFAISPDSIVEIAWNLEDPLRRPQCSCGPIFKVFGWLQKILLDALGDPLGLGLEIGKVR